MPVANDREQKILSLVGVAKGAAKRYHGDRDDLIQVAWIGVIKAVDTWNGTGSLSAWAWTNAHWEIGKYIRSYLHVRADMKAQIEMVELNDVYAVADRGIESAAVRIDARRSLVSLPPRDHAVVVVCAEFGPMETGRLLGCSHTSIGKVMSRAAATFGLAA